jgi:hypothetical protein
MHFLYLAYMKKRLIMLLAPFCQGISIAALCVCFSGRHFAGSGEQLPLLAVGIVCITTAVIIWQKNKIAFREESNEDLANARAGNNRKRYPIVLRYAAIVAGCLSCFGVLMLIGVVK